MRYLISLLLILGLTSSCNNSSNPAREISMPLASGNCFFSKNQKDAEGKQVRILSEEKFIATPFVDSTNRPSYLENDFFKGYMSCMRVDSTLGALFFFKIYSEDAFQYYGGIKKNNKITFILKSGRGVDLEFGKSASGTANLSSNITEYTTFVHIPSEKAKLLVSGEITRVVIRWTKKEEEYKVVNPHLFIDQIGCLK